MLLMIIAIIIGMAKPSLVIRWGTASAKTRKNVLKIYLIGIVICFAGALIVTPPKTTTPSPKATTSAAAVTEKKETPAPAISAEPQKEKERTTDELLAENKKLLEEMKPKKEELKIHVNKALSGYGISQVDPSVTSRDVFSITFNLAASGSDPETAKVLGAEVIQKLIGSAPPYNIDSYYIMVMNKQAPIGMVSYIAETGIYSFMVKGKSQQFTP